MKTFIAIFTCLTLITTPLTAAERQIDARYDFVWKGLVIGTSAVKTKLSPAQYSIAMDFETKGMLRWFVKGQSDVTSTGSLSASNAPVPALFVSDGLWKKKRSYRKVAFDATGKMIDLEIEQPEEWDEGGTRQPVPDDLQMGPDPASLIVSLLTLSFDELNAAGGKAEIKTFDGQMVMLNSLICDGTVETLKKTKRSVYAGDALACTISLKQISGFWVEDEDEKKKRKKKKRKSKKKRKKEEPFRMWFADVNQDGQIMPVRASVPTNWGSVKIYLSELTNEPAPAPVKGLISTAE